MNILPCKISSIDLHNHNILSVMHSLDKYIQFNFESETNNLLPFLDVLILRENNSFHPTVYSKQFAAFLLPYNLFSHLPNQKLTTFNTYVNRALNIYSFENLLKTELDYNKSVATERCSR